MPNHFSFSNIMFYFGLVMILFYIGAGLTLIFSSVLQNTPKEYKVIFGIFFVLYGIFRFVRVYPKLKNRNQNEEDD